MKDAIYSICFVLVLAYLAFGGARNLFKMESPKPLPNPAVTYVLPDVPEATDKKRFTF
jgi:hypothetical protein